MKDDPEFNIKFVSLVEKFPCLYDNTCTDYSKRNVVDSAWENVAKEIMESVQDCKERWKNLRACYTRHLKSLTDTAGSNTKARRPYYLAEHLNFLRPYTKSRASKGIYPIPQFLSPEDPQVMEREINDSEEDLRETSNSADHMPSQVECFGTFVYKTNEKSKTDLKQTFADVNKSAPEYFLSKTSSAKEKKIGNPDLDFLKSVLPDMSEMTNEQKRRFKIGILNLAGQILSENKPVSSPASSTSLQGYNYTNDHNTN